MLLTTGGATTGLVDAERTGLAEALTEGRAAVRAIVAEGGANGSALPVVTFVLAVPVGVAVAVPVGVAGAVPVGAAVAVPVGVAVALPVGVAFAFAFAFALVAAPVPMLRSPPPAATLHITTPPTAIATIAIHARDRPSRGASGRCAPAALTGVVPVVSAARAVADLFELGGPLPQGPGPDAGVRLSRSSRACSGATDSSDVVSRRRCSAA